MKERKPFPIYLAASIASRSDDFLPAYQAMHHHLEARGARVLTAHVAKADAFEAATEPREVFRRDMAWLKKSRLLIAEVSLPSLGVGFEISSALHLGKPVLCLYRKGTRISKLIAGIDDENFHIRPYSTPAEMKEIIDAFLEK